MAEQNGQERTERATPKRLADARKKGQVPRSRELTTAAVMLTAAGSLTFLGERIALALTDILHLCFAHDRASAFDPQRGLATFETALTSAVWALIPFFAVVMCAAIAAPAMTGGWAFSVQAMAFKIDKLNPVKGLKRVFSARGLLELLKTMAKFLLVGSVAVFFLTRLAGDVLMLGAEPTGVALAEAADLGLKALIIFSAPLLIIAGIDVPFQLYDHAKQLRMTRQEVRDEMKETDGNPEMKARIRGLQQEQANRRMMEQVPEADVVVTNPTHYAVALRYDPNRMSAPRVVAKGADLVAARIRAIASEHRVPMLSAPPLARALFRTTDLNQEIPSRLYAAVAQVLTWVYQVREVRRHGGEEPPAPDVDFRDNDEQ